MVPNGTRNKTSACFTSSWQDKYVNNGINRTTVLADTTESSPATEGVWPICRQINDKPLLFV